jgi:hypothetical protein
MTLVIPDKTITLGSLAFASSTGVRFRGLRLDGWDGATGSSLQLTQKLYAPGAWRSGNPQRTARVLVLSGVIEADSPQLMWQTLDSINAAATLDESKLTVDMRGTVRWAMVSQQADMTVTQYPSALVKGFSLQLVAADPRRFADPVPISTGLPSSTGGWTFPFTFPLTIASTVVSGTCSAYNAGDASGPVTLRIAGPVTGPIVTHVSTGAQLVFASSLALGVGEWIDVDMEAHTVLANGQSSRSMYVTSRGWSGFDAGQNVWAFTAQAYNSGALLTVTPTPAWV